MVATDLLFVREPVALTAMNLLLGSTDDPPPPRPPCPCWCCFLSLEAHTDPPISGFFYTFNACVQYMAELNLEVLDQFNNTRTSPLTLLQEYLRCGD